MSNNTAVALGVNAFNEAKQAEVKERAKAIIKLIDNSQKSRKDYEKFIADEQACLVKLADDVVTQRVIVGQEWTGELNANQVTILGAIKALNDDKQDQVKLRSQSHINKIEGYRQTIKNIDETIADYRKQLNELAVDVVSVESVVSQ